MENNKFGIMPINPALITPFVPILPGTLEDNNLIRLLDNNGDLLLDNG